MRTARKNAFKSYPIAMLAEKLQAAAMRLDTAEIAAINVELERRKSIGASNRPGDQAAEYAAETGCSYSQALVACNMD